MDKQTHAVFLQNARDLDPLATGGPEVLKELLGAAVGPAGATMSVAQVEMPSQGVAAYHFHPRVEETYYFLSGPCEMLINGKVTLVDRGDLVRIAPGTRHRVQNPSPRSCGYLVVCVPPWTPDCEVPAEAPW